MQNIFIGIPVVKRANEGNLVYPGGMMQLKPNGFTRTRVSSTEKSQQAYQNRNQPKSSYHALKMVDGGLKSKCKISCYYDGFECDYQNTNLRHPFAD